jgi:hypothetical protein
MPLDTNGLEEGFYYGVSARHTLPSLVLDPQTKGSQYDVRTRC